MGSHRIGSDRIGANVATSDVRSTLPLPTTPSVVCLSLSLSLSLSHGRTTGFACSSGIAKFFTAKKK